jgi:hypothetical protein
MNKFFDVIKSPTTWVIVITTIVAATAFSALRKPFVAIARKIPGADIAVN